jgi:hypothetical protein
MFEELQRAYEEHDSRLGLLRFDPNFAKYSNYPRCAALLEKMNLKSSRGEEKSGSGSF